MKSPFLPFFSVGSWKKKDGFSAERGYNPPGLLLDSIAVTTTGCSRYPSGPRDYAEIYMPFFLPNPIYQLFHAPPRRVGVQRFDSLKKEKKMEHTPRTTDMNLVQIHCLALRAPTLDLWLEITQNRKFVIQGFIWNTKFLSQVPTLLQAKMAQQGKQMRVGACEGFAYHPLKLVLLANGNRYEVDSNTFF